MTLVLVTRPGGADDPLSGALAVKGFGVAAVPTIATAPVEGGALARALAGLTAGDWIVVTSAAGARAVVAATTGASDGAGSSAGSLHWAAVGPATAAVLAAAGVTPRLVPERADGAALARAIVASGEIAGRRALLARSELADAGPVAILSDAGAEVIDVVAYRTVVGPEASRRPLNAALADPALAAVIFASGSAARGAVALADVAGRRRLGELAIVTIGPRTSAVVRSLDLPVTWESPHPAPHTVVAGVRRVLASAADGVE